MKLVMLLTLSALLSTPILAQSSDNPILGKWTNEEQTLVVEFTESEDTYVGTIVAAPKDELVGKTMITGLKHQGGEDYEKGTFIHPTKGKKIKCSVEIAEADRMNLKVKAGFTSKTMVWTRQ